MIFGLIWEQVRVGGDIDPLALP